MRYLAAVLLVTVMSLFVSCTDGQKAGIVQEFSAYITVDSAYTKDEFEIEGELCCGGAAVATLTITTPDELCTLTFSKGQDYTVGYHGLLYKSESAREPALSLSQVLFSVLKDLSTGDRFVRCKDDVQVFCGECCGFDYEVLTDTKGYIRQISAEELNLRISFEY